MRPTTVLIVLALSVASLGIGYASGRWLRPTASDSEVASGASRSRDTSSARRPASQGANHERPNRTSPTQGTARAPKNAADDERPADTAGRVETLDARANGDVPMRDDRESVATANASDALTAWLSGAVSPDVGWRRLIEQLLASTAADASEDDRIADLNSELEAFRAKLFGKLPTEVPDGRGEFSHPKILSRLVEETLAAAKQPLGDEQRQAVAELGRGYEASFDAALESFGDDTSRLTRVVREIELKAQFLDDLQARLDERQLTALEQLRTLPRPLGDLLSPLGMADVRFRDVAAGESERLRSGVERDLPRKFGVPSELAPQLAERFVNDLAPLLSPAAGDELDALDAALVAGRANSRLFDELLAIPDLDSSARKKVLEMLRWTVPRLR